MLARSLIVSMQIALSAIFISILASCDTGYDKDRDTAPFVSFEHDGLDGRSVSRLYQQGTQVFAGTNQGLFVKMDGGVWQSAGLPQAQVHDIAILSDEHYIVSIRQTVDGIDSDALIETTDGGESWQTINHNFGGETTETLFALHYDDVNNALYATGVSALAISLDEGRTWELLNGMWGGFGQPLRVVAHNPATNDIWYGGQNAIEEMVLVRYSLDTDEAHTFPNLLPSPSVIYGVEFDPENDEGVYVSGEGGVLKTEDNGETWIPLIDDVDHRFYFDIAVDPFDPDTLYTGGWDKNPDEPQPLILEVSTDDGRSWLEYSPINPTEFGGVRSVLSTTEAGLSVVYLGLVDGGIMKATVI